jgi:alpha-beta hydrolase superfamily lysophospholipase
MVFEGPVWNSRAHKRLAQEAAKNRPNRSRAGASTDATVSSSKAAVKKAPAKKAAVKKAPVKKVAAVRTPAKKAAAKKAASPR